MNLFCFYLQDYGSSLASDHLVHYQTDEMSNVREIHRCFSEQYRDQMGHNFHNTSFATTRSFFNNVVKKIYLDGSVNIGRIVAIYFLGTEFAKKCAENDEEGQIEDVLHWTVECVRKKISEVGGWTTSKPITQQPTV